MTTLTMMEKIMNMQKLGIVSHTATLPLLFKNSKEYNALHCTPYTLCVFQIGPTRNGSRYGFGFDVTPLSGHTSRRTAGGFCPGPYVIPGLCAMGDTAAETRAVIGSQQGDFFPSGKTVPPLKPAVNGINNLPEPLGPLSVEVAPRFRMPAGLGVCHA